MPRAKKQEIKESNHKKILLKFINSIWLFPALLTVLLLVFTVLKINGSSIGIYQSYFYGTQKDSALLANNPESVRSDEFLNNTQMTLAQSKDHYAEINKNIGHGENMSLVEDAPYRSWSELFKPHNLAFFVLPVDNAFAFKWWIMSYLLLISCYFFVLSMLPEKRLLAAGIAVALLFSAFVQWWYQYITLGPLYYSLFIATAFVHFLKQKDFRKKLLLAAAITYLLVCFALVFYPPYQIACVIALSGFIIGELIVYCRDSGSKQFLHVIGWLASCLVVAVAVVGLFAVTQSSVLHALDNTVYPGKRVIASGGFSVEHMLSGNLGYQFLSPTKAANYRLFGGVTNQSESSNFILLTPFLFVPSLFLLYIDKKRHRKTDWPLVGVNLVFILFLLELFVPAFSPISKLFLMQKIPLQREIIGLGLLNILQLVLFIRNLSKKKPFPNYAAACYVALVFLVELALGIYAHRHFPGFIGRYRVVLFSLPLPVIVYCLIRKHFRLGVAGFLLFSLFIGIRINPLYHGLSVIEKNPLDVAVQQIVHKSPNARWVADGLYLENFTLVNGAPSLSGVYYYPQPNIWKNIGPGNQSFIYNRYANVNFELLTSGDSQSSQIQLLGVDHFAVITDACSNFMRDNQVQYILTTSILTSPCIALVKQVAMPAQTFNIYKVQD
jgi:hypothetical protein